MAVRHGPNPFSCCPPSMRDFCVGVTITPCRHFTASSNAARNPVVAREGYQLLDVTIFVVPELDGIRKIERPPHSHDAVEPLAASDVRQVEVEANAHRSTASARL